jgi:hypothetical protein
VRLKLKTGLDSLQGLAMVGILQWLALFEANIIDYQLLMVVF